MQQCYFCVVRSVVSSATAPSPAPSPGVIRPQPAVVTIKHSLVEYFTEGYILFINISEKLTLTHHIGFMLSRPRQLCSEILIAFME